MIDTRHVPLRSHSVRRRLARGLTLAACAAALFSVDVSSAYAQIETIVVTARKRAENVQNVPVAVSTLSNTQLDNQAITSIENVAAVTPQLIVQRGSSGSGADISLRGIGSSWENIGIEQSVAVVVDGVYFGQGRVLNDGFFDMKQVEVLKGPQALYFGKNATAGVISLQSNDPTDTFEAMARVGYEVTAENPEIEGYVSGPVTDTLGLRLAFRGSDMFGGYFTNEAAGGLAYTTIDAATFAVTPHVTDTPTRDLPQEKDGLVRLTAKWTPTDDFTLNVKGTWDVYKTGNNASNVVTTFCPLGHPQLDPAETCGKQWKLWSNDIPADIAATDPLLNKHHGRAFEDYQSYTVIANAQYTTPQYTVTSVSGFQHLYNDWANDQDFTQTPAVMAGEHFTWKAFSTEERLLTTFDDPINFSGGIYYQSTELDFNQDVLFAGSENSAAVDPTTRYVSYRKLSGTEGQTWAAFGQLIWDLTPKLELTAGARYTHEIKSSFFEQPYVNPFLTFLFVPSTAGAPFTGVITAHQDFDNVSPEAMLTWKPQDNLTIYGGWKRGFKSGGFSNSAINSTLGIPEDLMFRPEKADGYEGGVKSTWLDDQLRVDVNVYNYVYSDLQVDFFNTPTFNYVTLNAASARTTGAEVQAEYAPEDVKGLVLSGTAAYDDAHYGHFIAPCSPAGISYQQGCTFTRLIDPVTHATSFAPCTVGGGPDCGFMDISGAPTALAPMWTASLGADYTTPVGDGLELGLSGSFRYSSSYVANGFASGIARIVDKQSSYGNVDASVRLSTDDDRWMVAIIGKNLTDNFIISGAQGLPLTGAGTGLPAGSPGQILSDQGGVVLDPRTVAFQVTYRY